MTSQTHQPEQAPLTEPPSDSADEAVRHQGSIVRFVSTISDRLAPLELWFVNPRDMQGVGERLAAMSLLFFGAIGTTLSFCLVAYFLVWLF
ncbi:MAG: hypothetical protein GYB68_12810 [Chloroflexi bacterium]|nr:hypothetical protein [Chloroflexota bacterium]